METYGAGVFDEYLGPAEGVLGGRDGQVSEESRDAVDGDAGAVGPRQRRQHLVTQQERRVQLTEHVTVAFHPSRLQQPFFFVVAIFKSFHTFQYKII